ncbi:YafY family protein [Mangrovibacterium marinum]|uniref:Putative DNA-binding transcriptional regulator YafY n=1 Tax=Mangrovibacterium marinum TaxID=1639118 RepID=A0A2T5C452_9BACT|nr:WYL domain-containing protein [Mangrovibacterium marinum]PTN09605.1 putative DNA-binding transcriptional regulator YafY [Mangrovibacterium marinum]
MIKEQHKLGRLLEIMIYLSSGIRRSLHELSERFEISERTAFRYIQTFRDAGFIIPKPHDGLYQIDKSSPYFKEISELLHFSKEEAFILQRAIHSISDENLLKQKLVAKLYALYDFDRVADTIVKQEYSENIHQLMRAIREKRKVILKGYLSANSNEEKDRLVEPFEFTTNYVSIWAYDTEDGICKTFKNTRIASVVVLDEPWCDESRHATLPMDVFRINAPEQQWVELELSIRAGELLKEEYPLSEGYITELAEGRFRFAAPVSGFEGVGRFIMGLASEIRVLSPPGLKEFIQNKAKKISTDIS